MTPYGKTPNIWARDPRTHKLIDNQWVDPTLIYLRDLFWRFTEKVDGTNIRLIYDRGALNIRGRSDNATVPRGVVDWMETALNLGRFQTAFGEKTVCFYGEGCGPGIQSVGLRYGDQQHVRIFAIKIGHIWLERITVEEICETLDLPIVRVCGYGTLLDGVETIRTGKTENMEGLIAEPAIPLLKRDGSRIIVKLKNKDLL